MMMEEERSHSAFLYIYSYSLCCYALIFAEVSWGWMFSRTAVAAFICVISLFKIEENIGRFPKSTLYLSLSLLLYCFLTVSIWNAGEKFVLLRMLALFLSMSSIMLLPYEEKQFLLRAMTNCFLVILIVSVPAWILYLLGFPFSHGDVIVHADGFHESYNWGFFLTSSKFVASIFPRFQSIFLEPGQFATPCAFLYFLNGANFSRKNILFFAGIILSFSLVSYVLTLMAIIVNRLFRSESNRLLKIFITILAMAIVSGYFVGNEDEDDPIYALIVSRLQYDEEKGIAGNNRTSAYFDSHYEKLMDSPERFLGVHHQLKSGNDWTTNSSGYKKFIAHRGIIGFGIFMFFIFLLFYYNRSLPSFAFLGIVIAGFLPRDLLQSPLWLSIAVMGFFLMNESQLNDELEDESFLSVENPSNDGLL